MLSLTLSVGGLCLGLIFRSDEIKYNFTESSVNTSRLTPIPFLLLYEYNLSKTFLSHSLNHTTFETVFFFRRDTTLNLDKSTYHIISTSYLWTTSYLLSTRSVYKYEVFIFVVRPISTWTKEYKWYGRLIDPRRIVFFFRWTQLIRSSYSILWKVSYRNI